VLLYYVGQLGDDAMTAGFGLSIAFVDIIGTSILCGMNSAQETLTSQAFGAQELRRCGHLFNRGKLILLVLCVPIAMILLYSNQIFLLIGQEPEVARYAA
jgi:multidrug resistance protein, MATE family